MLGTGAIARWAEAVRRNHALEHATVAVLLARHGPTRLAGRAAADGFFLFGDVEPDEVVSCAREALDRMQHGQRSLAVSPLCGTNLAVAGFLAAGASTAVVSRGRGQFGNAFTAAMAAVVLAQPIGRIVQQYITTSPRVDAVEVVGIRTIFGNLRKVQTRPTS